jgi:hypothetical protein
MIAFLLLLQAGVTFVPAMTPLPEPTPASRTRPIDHYDCRLIGESGSPLRLVVQREGHQGYLDETTLPDKPFVTTTPITFRILKDGTGLLGSMKYLSLGSLRRVGQTFKDDKGNIAVFTSDLWPEDKTKKAILSLYFYPKGAIEPQVYAGPCKVMRIEQLPLDHDPEKRRQGA